MKPRKYQLEAAAAIFEQFKTVQRTLAVMCTASGKTQVAAYVAKQFIAAGGRVIAICHREELIRQAAHRFEQICGTKPDIEKADEWANETNMHGRADIIVASVQTLVSGGLKGGLKRYQRFNPKEFALLWCDECHHGTSSTFREVIAHFCQNQDLRCLGVTATPDRADEEALGEIFQSVAYEYELPDGIKDGYILPVRQRSVTIEGLDFSRVRTTGGDLNKGDLEEAMILEKPLHGTAFASIELACGLSKGTLADIGEDELDASRVAVLIGENRREKTIVFTVTVAHAEMMASIFNRWIPGSAVHIDGAMSHDLRRKNIKLFTDGSVQFLVNCMIATEGTDLPVASCVVMARPTESRALFSQMLGRVIRPSVHIAHQLGELATSEERRALIASSDKPAATVLDFVGNSGRHSLVSTVDILGEGESPEVLSAAKEYMGEEDMSVEDAIQKSRDEIERKRIESEKAKKKREEEAAAAQQAEMARRAKLVANAEYHVTDHDPYAPAYQMEQRDSATDEAMAFCRENLHKSQFSKVTPANAARIKADILRRRFSKLASWKQVRILEGNGFTREQTINMPMKQAGAILDGLFQKWEAAKAKP